ncbi:MAG: DUF4007 family protein [Oscillospiraceae bacterium]
MLMPMKFRAHDTFFIRKGWLSKGMRCVSSKPDVFIAHDENPMDVLGIGANMVKALRYWLQAVGLTAESTKGKRMQQFTDLGTRIYEQDTYIEELGTLYLLQYCLASQKEEATAWYFFFNEFSILEFSRDDFVSELQKYIKMEDNETNYAIRSLNDDFQCIISTYLPRYKSNPTRVSPENNIECPFGELGLIDVLNKRKKTYKKSIPASDTLNPYVILAVISDNAHGRREISLNELLTAPCNIGKVFNLDSITMLDVLYRIEKLGHIKINRTSGLDVIEIQGELSFLDCVDRFYASINEQGQEKTK